MAALSNKIMSPLRKMLLLLATVLVLINFNIDSIEGGRVLIIKKNNLNLYLESSLQRDARPAPNPKDPGSINQRNFAGGHTKSVPPPDHDHHAGAPIEPRHDALLLA